MEPRAPSRPGASAFWILSLLLVAGILTLSLPRFLKSRRLTNEQKASEALKLIAAAEANFRANDRDGNRIQDFWTGDVAGLADLALLPAEIGNADPSRPGARPYHGYWFMAMDLDETSTPYRQDTLGLGTEGRLLYNHSKFAFTAYPADYGWSGKHTFRVNEDNTLFREDHGGKPRLEWPPFDPSKAPYSTSPR